MEGWGGIPLAFVAATGDLTQLYPNFVSAGDALPVAANGTLRAPGGGRIGQVSVQTDGTNGGYIELWDVNGLDIPADVSSLTVITNAQLVALQARGLAKLMWSQNFAALPAAPAPWALAMGFMRGLAARFVAGAGACNINVIVEGGYVKRVCPLGFAG